MFPTPIQQRSHARRFSYQVFLPIALILWLLPLIAVMIFSIKPDGDFVKGNFWGLPSSFEIFQQLWARFLCIRHAAISVEFGLHYCSNGDRRSCAIIHDGFRPWRL